MKIFILLIIVSTAAYVVSKTLLKGSHQNLSTNQSAQATEKKQDNKVEVKIGDTIIKAALARTMAETTKGLGGVENLPEDEGMIFDFGHKVRNPFWMKGMKIPIDMIFIADGEVSQIEANKQPGDLGLVVPNDPYDYVLEVNASFAQNHNIVVGDKVEVKVP